MADASPWQTGRLTEIRDETARAKTYRLALERPMAYRAGQHVVLRLTAPDGYRAMRSYSIASAPNVADEIELTVEALDGGEVSGFLHDVAEVGDELELRGPIGGWFVWDGGTPALLLGGGSGLVPLMAMLRLARATGQSDLVRLAVSVRSPADLLYRGELPGPEVTIAYTRQAAPASTRPAHRLTVDDLAPLLRSDMIRSDATAYVCGSAGFADAASRLLVELDVPVERIRVERFGPTAATAGAAS